MAYYRGCHSNMENGSKKIEDSTAFIKIPLKYSPSLLESAPEHHIRPFPEKEP